LSTLGFLFSQVFENYLEFYNTKKTIINNIDMKELVSKKIPKELAKQLNLSEDNYKVKGSYGNGNLTETPWIAIFDLDITDTAQKGFYIVFLFKADMNGVYLSLNQGTTYLSQKFKGMNPRNKMKQLAECLREELTTLTDDVIYKIDLSSRQQNAKYYMSANIGAKYYSPEDFPEDQRILDDIKVLMNSINEVKKVVGVRSLDQFIDDLLWKEQLDDAKYQEDVIVSKPSKTEEKPYPVPNKRKNNSNKQIYDRNPAIAKEALINAKYRCEFDPSHFTFISEITKNNFVEAHHLVPMNMQDKFDVSLDVPGNIVSLCPNCHRRIHHATLVQKKEIINILYERRKSLMDKFGIKLSLEQLLEMYK
jgi:5-methylcytosine-specific restriction enzyme A